MSRARSRLSSSDDEEESFTFTESTHVRLTPKKPVQVYAMKTLKRGLLQDAVENCAIEMIRSEPEEHRIEFELRHCDVSIANALRRLMISNVPSCAIDDVYIKANTGVMQDEMLAHRLGMIPILHPGIADFKTYVKHPDPKKDVKTADDTLVFRLQVRCGMQDLQIGEHDCLFMNVTSADLKWVPQGPEQEAWPEAMRPRCTLDDIVITRLGLNQAIDVEAHCVKGIGATHAKWSPVATAAYRMFPEIRFRNEDGGSDDEDGGITGDLARELVELHGDIFELEEDIEEGHGGCSAVVAHPENCTFHMWKRPHFNEHLEILRVRDRFLFSIETTGVLRPKDVFLQSIALLRGRAQALLDCADEWDSGSSGGGGGAGGGSGGDDNDDSDLSEEELGR